MEPQRGYVDGTAAASRSARLQVAEQIPRQSRHRSPPDSIIEAPERPPDASTAPSTAHCNAWHIGCAARRQPARRPARQPWIRCCRRAVACHGPAAGARPEPCGTSGACCPSALRRRQPGAAAGSRQPGRSARRPPCAGKPECQASAPSDAHTHRATLRTRATRGSADRPAAVGRQVPAVR